MPKHVFISYQHEDGDFADNLIYKIKEAGLETCVDNDRLHAGEDWRAEIDTAIKNAFALVVVMTPEAKSSEYVTYEWAFAWGAGVKVVPLMYKETALHPRFEALHYLNFTNHIARPWESLIATLNNAADVSHSSSTSSKNPSAPLHTSQKTKEQWVTMADMCLEQQDYEEALETYGEALRLGPDAAAYSGKGKALNSLKRYDEALTAYKQAIRLDFNYAPTYEGKGTALTNLKRYSEALTAFKQAIRLNPVYAPSYNGRGDTFYALYRYDEALTAYEEAIRLDADNAEYHNSKGYALSRLKRYKVVLAVFEKAIRLNPNNAIYYNNKGSALMPLLKFSEAWRAYAQARKFVNRESGSETVFS
jgi:tetratricopeptide (TPR) repeat protein